MSPAHRLAWLDVLRGIGALAVAFHHGTFHYLPELRRGYIDQFSPGIWGVLVFFLVSGFIIPASLERTGSVRRFWIGRLFRIHPLLLVALGGFVVLGVTGLSPMEERLGEGFDPVAAVLAHLTMLQDLLSVPSALNVLWTLSYEMIFYLLVVGLFALRVHRRSATVTLAVAGTALAIGPLLPTLALTRGLGLRPAVVVVTVAVVLSIVLACSRRPGVARAGALLGGATGLAVVLFNSRIEAWQGLVLLAMMFLGTAVHRADQGELAWRWVALAGVGTVTAALVLGRWGSPDMVDDNAGRAWNSAVLLAVAAFAAAMALRDRRMPRVLAWLGVISYSVYLLHPLVLALSDGTIWRPERDNPWWMAGYLVAVVALSAVTHRLVETPMQRLGRRVARRADPGPPSPGAVPASSPAPEPSARS